MATSNQIGRAINRAQKLQERQAALDAKLREAAREADRIVGEALREGATDSRSRWAKYADLNMKEFYFLVVEGVEPSLDDSETASEGDSTPPAEPENHGSDFGEATADFVSGNQGF
ncbi:hypothetical protein GWO53_10390 [Corynebacterium macginleyi]|uniref:Uncharacterized protein n=2 Tax=Corynebacterium macginleyi TaxID=38290 RepID=A0ABS1Y4H5_9CORY|nr:MULTISPECIES: hypothetical protein [Corynebacterium]MBK4140831.1 hypothetical protein [Corynebacterium macginleyi]MBK4145072.1 hypothetical protein [Corynebacterium macginleyi]MBK4151430.1 hypothetical protein [Corynebacterium macginleyi]MBK4153580.1 hypothetical protein [Corynebacterium macginleyi]MBK4157885.1 hypothetical protein [Corynebacterium macginleyi]